MKKGKSETILRMLGALIVILILTILLYRYFNTEFFPEPIKENPRFLTVDTISLENEASLIKSSYGLTNKTAQNVFVLTYHRITKGPPTREYEISFDQFKENMFELKRQGYQTITTKELYSFMKGEKSLPEKSFLLTFDDGPKQAYYNGDPILKALNYTAIFFIIAGHVEDNDNSPYYLNNTELAAIKETGRWEIESHTYRSHFRLPIGPNGEIGPALTNKLWIENENRIETDQEYFTRVNEDLVLSKNVLEKNFNLTLTSFALPYGDFGERKSNYPDAYKILNNLTSNNYKLVFYEFPLKYAAYRANYPELGKESHTIARIPSDSFQTPERLLQIVESTNAVNIPYYEDYTHPDKWIRLAGSATFYNDSIRLLNGTIGASEGVMAYLDGSYNLKNYLYSVELKNSTASEIILISRFKDPLNYVACRYYDNTVSIIKYSEDISFDKINQTTFNETIKSGTRLSMSVIDSKVRCFIDRKEKITSETTGIPPYGGVGIKAQNFGEDKSFLFGDISIV